MASGDLPATAQTTAGGICRIDIRVTGRQHWAIQQVSNTMLTAPGLAVCALYKNSIQVTPLLPTSDAAAGDPPVNIGPGDVLSVIWTGATPGDYGNVYVIYDDGTG